MELSEKKCVPCEGGVPVIKGDEIEDYTCQLKMDWDVVDEIKIRKEFVFPDFVTAMDFANRVGDIAEEEGHHPDLHIYYGKVIVELWTHAIGGLSENDFIVAARINQITH
jgi:4a-hydroxytetrahydrobiopterin dehydratase